MANWFQGVLLVSDNCRWMKKKVIKWDVKSHIDQDFKKIQSQLQSDYDSLIHQRKVNLGKICT